MEVSLRAQGRSDLTFLIGHPELSWSAWLTENAPLAKTVSLDIAQPKFGPPVCITEFKNEEALGWSFVGATDPIRFPLALISGLARALPTVDVVLGFPYRPSPVARQLLIDCLRLAHPDRILAPRELDRSLQLPFPIDWVQGLPASPTSHAQAAKRRGRWIECLESCETHNLHLSEVKIEGARLGSGVPVENLGGHILYAESCGGTLLLATRDALDDHSVAEALDTAHARRAVVVNPSSYIGLVCCFAKEDGTDFGIGRLTDIDFASRTLTCRTTAVAPTKVPVLKLGGIRIDETGRELAAPVPWSL